ncbi:short-chain dehydrogenase/reductase SDR [Methylophaga frappieri]|uniref:Short-chain dehydrogenase/reductase SDR n=1 Tax=Methylophaga frappieri (strain ATCC BAA-2434 / DSM 25690 / JAM7) TaxID=754477 RepID=I1YLD4_METFJ|nr:SDR family NAD(P)-dependent oxidoreductase [Methylophaga frappieri]AFJ03727.1 short-chain dehydrogenase/reductase SDR [Methylophaga frappieri]
MNLNAKTAIVTGASSGIGAATAKELARKGARVILLARNEARLKEVQSEIKASGGDAHYYALDLADAEMVENVAKQINTEIGTPDILINNAGRGQWKDIQETSADEAWQMMEVPYFAAFNLTRAFLPEMRRRNCGHIVNISSVSSRFVWPGATAYHAARWAMKGFNEALRADLYGKDIGVTLFESGVVESEYWQHNPGSRERVPKIAKMIPNLTPEQVAKAIVKGIEKNKRRIVIPFMMKTVCWQHFMFPSVVQWLMTVTGYRRSS